MADNHLKDTVHLVCLPARPALDLDAIKAAGLNSTVESLRLLAEHAAREHADVKAHFRRRELA